jgi:porin
LPPHSQILDPVAVRIRAPWKNGSSAVAGRSQLTFRFVFVAAILTALLLELDGLHYASAQTVDVERSLIEDRAGQRPLLPVRPWQWTRGKLQRATSLINDLIKLKLGMTDTTLYQIAPEAPTPHHTLVGTLDVYGAWNLVHSATLGDGTLGFVYRNRNVWGPLTGNELATDVGLPWGTNNSGSEAYKRLDQVWWQQSLLHDSLVIQAGKIDETAYFNTNRVASSDAEDFLMQSLSYSQTIAFPGAGLGFNIRYLPDPHLYIDASLSDANGNPANKPNDSLNSFLQGNYFEALEAGFTPDMKTVWPPLSEGHYRLMAWHSATVSAHEAGSGVALSADQQLPKQIVPFLRVGYCPAGAGRTSTEVDWGVVSVAPFGRPTDRLGLGVTWAKPTAASTNDQFAFELFYRAQVVDGLQLTPDVEFIPNPALNPGSGFQAVFGVRVRGYL